MKAAYLLLLLPVLSSLVISNQIANAQTYQPSNRTPVSDNTLGTQVSGNGNNFNITGGLTKGQTLFHSFTDFSVPTNGSTNFLNPVGNRDIITRVTGSVFSDINGTVNTNGANFFLINPNGIVFGTNAQLNVGKAFVASTANSLDLVDAGGRAITFGTNPNGDALLTVAPNVLFDVSRLNMGGGNGQISNFGTLQTTNPSQYIGLIGGNVQLDGGRINAPGGRVELAGLSAFGTVVLGVDGNNLQIQLPLNVARGDVSLSNGSRVNVAGAGSGDISISARNLNILDGSALRGGIEAGLGLPEALAGNITIDATGEIALVGFNSAIANNVRFDSTGSAGDISIDTGSLSLREGAILQASTYGAGNTGNVTVTAKDTVFLSNAYFFNTVESGAVGKGGNIGIQAGSFSLRDGAEFSASTYGKGETGKITIDAKEILSLDNGSFISSIIYPQATGNSRGININTKELKISNLSAISSDNLGGIGNAGSINIKTTGDLNIIGDGRSIPGIDTSNYASFITSSTQGIGDTGKITIDVDGNLNLTNKGAISSTINRQAQGNSQGITISAKNVNLSNRSFISTSNAGGTGNAGNIDIKTTSNLTMVGSDRSIPVAEKINYTSFITSGTFGKGDAGNIAIDIGGNLLLTDRSSISSDIAPQAEGNSNGINISAKQISLLNNSDIETSNLGGKGTAGDINIKSTGDLIIAGYTDLSIPFSDKENYRSSISSKTSGLGDAGKINIDIIGNLSIDNGAFISSVISPQAEGNSNGINISANNINLSNNGVISTLNGGGKGNAGNIDIKTTGDITIASFTDPFLSQSERDRSIASIASDTSGIGNTGKITIDARGNLSLADRGIISSSIYVGADGNSQGINIKAKNVRLTNTGQITTTNVDGKGNAGNINIQSQENVELINSSGIASASTSEGQAANISISSQKLNLDRSLIYTIGASVGGGDITLALSNLLLLRNNSFITTTSDSTGKNGNGGNITINSPLIVATPKNNDITANAYAGNGGKVNIISQGLFGIQYRPLGSEFTNDITSSSTFGQNGTVNISTPGTDPGRDSTELPNTTTDASNQISQVCSANNRQNKLTVTGRGGLPPNANDPLTSDVVWQDARATSRQPVASNVPNQPHRLSPPAVGMVFDGKGKVTLIAAGSSQGQPTGTRVDCPKKEGEGGRGKG